MSVTIYKPDIYIFSAIDSETAQEVIWQALALNKPPVICINSCGGSVYDALAMADMLQPLEPVIIGTGMVGSAAVLVMLSGAKRLVTKTATIYVHPPEWDYSSPQPVGAARTEADYHYELQSRVVDYMASRTGLPADEIVQLLESRRYMSAQEAMACKVATSYYPVHETTGVI